MATKLPNGKERGNLQSELFVPSRVERVRPDGGGADDLGGDGVAERVALVAPFGLGRPPLEAQSEAAAETVTSRGDVRVALPPPLPPLWAPGAPSRRAPGAPCPKALLKAGASPFDAGKSHIKRKAPLKSR